MAEKNNSNQKIEELNNQLQIYKNCFDSLLKILKYKAKNLQDFLDYSLEELINLTKSKIGYIYYYSEEKKEFTLNTWSREVMKECTVKNPQTIYQLEKTGIWGEAVRQKKPIIVNDFQAPNPLKKGYPAGHAPLFKYMTIPVFFNDKIVAVLGLANKKTDYTDDDINQTILLMAAIWEIAERQKIEEELNKKTLELEKINKFMVGREMKMIEMKKEINKFKK